jgi:hypothetical protein
MTACPVLAASSTTRNHPAAHTYTPTPVQHAGMRTTLTCCTHEADTCRSRLSTSTQHPGIATSNPPHTALQGRTPAVSIQHRGRCTCTMMMQMGNWPCAAMYHLWYEHIAGTPPCARHPQEPHSTQHGCCPTHQRDHQASEFTTRRGDVLGPGHLVAWLTHQETPHTSSGSHLV